MTSRTDGSSQLNGHGRDVMRYWRLWRPKAFDDLADPGQYFAEVGERHAALIEATAQERSARGELQALEVLRGFAAEQVEYRLPYGQWEVSPDWFDCDVDQRLDPSQVDEDGMPRDPGHPLWELLDDPQTPANVFHDAWQAWLDTVPKELLLEVVGEVAVEDLDEAAWEVPDLVRLGNLTPGFNLGDQVQPVRLDNESQIYRTREWFHTRGGWIYDAERAFQVLQWAVEERRPWVLPGILQRVQNVMSTPLLVDDGSELSTPAHQALVEECGELDRGSQYVVVDGQASVIDYAGVSWISAPQESPSSRPLLLIDVDGCLSPLTLQGETLPGFEPMGQSGMQWHPGRIRRLFALADRYDLAWGTTWEDEANALARGLGLPELPVVRVSSGRSAGPSDFDCGKVDPIRRYVGARPFAWLDDHVSRADATKLANLHNCMIIRTSARRGVEEHHVRRLGEWFT